MKFFTALNRPRTFSFVMVTPWKLSGSAFAGGTHGSWQSNNVGPELQARGLTVGEKVDHISDYNFAIGGPFKQDKLWYFTTIRRIATNELVANNFFKSGEQGMEDQWIYNALLRLTWQMTPKNKITAYYDRYPKFKGHEMFALYDPETAAARRDWEHAIYYTGSVKYTSTITSRLLLEAGYSTNIEYLYIGYQPGIQKARGMPDWFTQIGKVEFGSPGVATNPVTGYQYQNWDGRVTPANGIDPKKYVISTSASYVTGSHNIKTGFQWGFGSYVLEYDINGDLVQRYRNGLPDSVTIYNTPNRSETFLNGDRGFYVQDSWKIKQLTINPGIRFEYFNSQIDARSIEPGRFIGFRQFAEVKDLPNWFDVAPRLGFSYDLFGNARTALKATFGKYMAGQTTSFPARYNPLQIQSDTRTWRDLNGDRLWTPNESNLSLGAGNPDFVSITAASNYELSPELKQPNTWETTASYERELAPSLGFRVMYINKIVEGTLETINAKRPYSAYSVPITRRDPGPDGVLNTSDDAGRVTMFDYSAAYQGAALRQGQAGAPEMALEVQETPPTDIADLGRSLRTGGQVQAGFPVPFDIWTRLFLSYAGEGVRFGNTGLLGETQALYGNNSFRSSLGLTITRDTRVGNPFPTSGGSQSLSIAGAIEAILIEMTNNRIGEADDLERLGHKVVDPLREVAQGGIPEAGAAFPGNMFEPIDLLKPLLGDPLSKGRRREPPRGGGRAGGAGTSRRGGRGGGRWR